MYLFNPESREVAKSVRLWFRCSCCCGRSACCCRRCDSRAVAVTVVVESKPTLRRHRSGGLLPLPSSIGAKATITNPNRPLQSKPSPLFAQAAVDVAVEQKPKPPPQTLAVAPD
ncbi:hypothetical protein Nepgr_011869 [Nepenthes gracilis]|uniref:Uncharacterized protein n=1 Tax=Nepenthes gracilis TaxID=150966 RepID=A0AAD3SF22_NEPGR|nr:hypothetical protein Nepgr_011869 [Nepenthes gracilis]